jgi:uncharacterized protein YutE (UPF0331/DUF86 family)
MGYDDDVLCGNIVNVRRGLAAVEEGLEAIRTLLADEMIKPAEAQKILLVLRSLREKILHRVVELHARVWWVK